MLFLYTSVGPTQYYYYIYIYIIKENYTYACPNKREELVMLSLYICGPHLVLLYYIYKKIELHICGPHLVKELVMLFLYIQTSVSPTQYCYIIYVYNKRKLHICAPHLVEELVKFFFYIYTSVGPTQQKNLSCFFFTSTHLWAPLSIIIVQ